MHTKLLTEEVETDVLVVGGGIAGCMAAIKAATKLGVTVTVADKGQIERSGNAATGVDHFCLYHPEIHGAEGYTVEEFVRDDTRAAQGFANQDLIESWVADSYARFLDWEKFGINIRDAEGRLRMIGRPPRRVPTHAHFDGRDLKVYLSKVVRDAEVQVVNRVHVTDILLHDGAVAGALGVDTREAKAWIFRAKAVILCTGGVNRLYPNPEGVFFNISHNPSETGDGRVIAAKAGASLYNMELPWVHTGPRRFHRCGRFSYYPHGVLTDAHGLRLGHTTPQGQYIDDAINDVTILKKVLREGRGPIYMDCTAGSPEDLAYIKWAMSNEGNYVYLEYLDKEGIDFGRNPIEFGSYELWGGSEGGAGIDVDVSCATSVRGLFAAGDELAGIYHSAASGAAAMGWIAGARASNFTLKSHAAPAFAGGSTIKARVNLCAELLHRGRINPQRGASWQEAQLALQNIMGFYAGDEKSATMMEAGLDALSDLREQAREQLKAQNPHELSRALEVLNLVDIGEMVLRASLDRKESIIGRSLYFSRLDFPARPDPNGGLHFVVLRMTEGGKIEVTHRPVRHKYGL